MSESFSPSPAPQESFAPTHENIAKGLKDLTPRELIDTRLAFDNEFTRLSDDFSEKGVAPTEEQMHVIGKSADRYMQIVEEFNNRTGMSDEQKKQEAQSAIAGLNVKFDNMRTASDLMEELNERYAARELDTSERNRAHSLITAIANKHNDAATESGLAPEEAERQAEVKKQTLLSWLIKEPTTAEATTAPGDGPSAEGDKGPTPLDKPELTADDAKQEVSAKPDKLESSKNPEATTWAERFNVYIESSGGIESLTPEARKEMIDILRHELRHLKKEVSPNAQLLDAKDLLAIQLLHALETSLAQKQDQQPHAKEDEPQQPERPLAMPNPALVEVSPPPPPDARQPQKTDAQIVLEDLKKYEKLIGVETPHNPKMLAKHLNQTIKKLEKYNMRLNRNFEKQLKKGKHKSEISLDPTLPDALDLAYHLRSVFKQEAKDARLHRRIGRKLAGRGTPDRSVKSDLPENGSTNSAPSPTIANADSAPDARELPVERVAPASPEDIRDYAINLARLSNFVDKTTSTYSPEDVIRYTDRILRANTGEHRDEELHKAAIALKKRMNEELISSTDADSMRPRQDNRQLQEPAALQDPAPKEKLANEPQPAEKAPIPSLYSIILDKYAMELDTADTPGSIDVDKMQSELSDFMNTLKTLHKLNGQSDAQKQIYVESMRRALHINDRISEIRRARQRAAGRDNSNQAQPPAPRAGGAIRPAQGSGDTTPPPPSPDQQPSPNPQAQPPAPVAGQQPHTAGDVARDAVNKRLDRYEQEHPIRGAFLRGVRSGRQNSQGTPPPPSAGDAGPGYPNIPPPPTGLPKDSKGNPLRPIEEVDLVR